MNVKNVLGTSVWHGISGVSHFMGLFILCILIVGGMTQPFARAAELTNRSISTSSSVGSASTSHLFTFSIQTSTSVGSIAFEYCENSPILNMVCNPPVGFNISAAPLALQQGATGFSVHPNTSVNRAVIGRVSAITTPGNVSYRFDGVVNPSGSPGTIYVKIFTFASNDGTGASTDFGAVTFSIQNTLSVGAFVPPFLFLCTGVVVSVDCTSTAGFGINLGELSKTDPNIGTTQFAVATNSFTGYTTYIQGTTMTAGNRIIQPLATQTASEVGVGQFGINLVQNSSPIVGNVVEGAGTGVADSNYSSQNLFRFQSGDLLSSSPISSDFNRYTISYLVNVGTNQSPGRYAATFTILATTTF